MRSRFNLTIIERTWQLADAFVIARGAKTSTTTLEVQLSDGSFMGRGECVPSRSNHEELAIVKADLQNAALSFETGAEPSDVIPLMATATGRSAVDCALWDFRAKQADKRVWQLVHITVRSTVSSCISIGIGTPSDMASKAVLLRNFSILKLKLIGTGDIERIAAVRSARPDATIIVDANESWSPAYLQTSLPELRDLGVALLEQPLHRDADDSLRDIDRCVPICADESFRTTADLPKLVGKYDFLNIKLEKAGGLTSALEAAKKASDLSFRLMVGCMVGTSLNVAPARLVAELCEFCDLDAPLLLAQDRKDALAIENGRVGLPHQALWG
ncbi:dipeptide epimerase [Agrobacterium tumefaciens]|uniref:Dipeptide epimerase n=1 Tax=Agrobacterium tumefaciens TaxID=358 RepID=A0AA44F0I8_AGRTU|nr:dipeptide epimerase [Agrobacterium tumefaciens]NSL23069.1 dipeptide epimerase [Agrobacterium tumefaciens]NTB89656.1 dipeptide epimerase [Agrobacterium tumefaciens]NTC15486.1 dipeptide epimerase [Agrobacterium tumefaciens]NTC26570.1 dipeptide epimerase [Agrobacterium tumefaciens]NTC58148.1 dipeptide epimerase [Agrobacterium tumefaciens]